MKPERLRALLDNLPASPGVYLMRGTNGRIVYVGKAKNLRNRVRQYFAPGTGDTRVFVRNLADKLSDIEIVVTPSEKDAALLEYNLIQRHLPRYNIRLTDDKRFLCIRLDLRDQWPKLELVRKPAKDGAVYFGPYPSASAARKMLRTVNRHFQLRSCKDTDFRNRVRPCLQHQIKRCLAPCCLPVNPAVYRQQMEYVRLFLEGRKDRLIALLTRRMEDAAQAFQYEAAASLRDQIAAVRDSLAAQQITAIHDGDKDLVALYREGGDIAIAVVEVVEGRVTGVHTTCRENLEFPGEEILSSFLTQYYARSGRIPPEILVSLPLDDADGLAALLAERRGGSVRIAHPRRGKKREQLAVAHLNAKEALTQYRVGRSADASRAAAVARALHLDAPVHTIACVDIAHLGGENTVAAFSWIRDGQEDRRLGRAFRIRAATGGDDFSAMREALERRLLRAHTDPAAFPLPDLLLVDGGKGQLRIAQEVLDAHGVSLPLAAIAKERTAKDGAECDRVYLPGRKNPVPIRSESTALFVLAAARDAAHRLANGFHRKQRTRRRLRNRLEDIPGVGPALATRLVRHFGNQAKVAAASMDALQQVPGIGAAAAARIHAFFHPDGEITGDTTGE